jgi:REP element-mobilizing transposase RayT
MELHHSPSRPKWLSYFLTTAYIAFLDLFEEAQERLPMRVLAWCLVPNHFHLVLWPHEDGDLSRWMQWLLTSHVRRYHRHYHGSGHVWQGRFKAFPIHEDEHLWTVYGSESWQHATAERLGLEASLHPRGRPRMAEKK